MSKFKYPVDTDQFQIIREQGLLYVDKTDLMFDLANRYRYVFLARPRRFGKSLLCNTFKAYFQGQKELFNGLKVMKLEKEWTKFPVLHFDMSELKNCTNIQSMRNILSDMIARYEEQFGAVKMIEEEGARFRRLLEHIYSSMGKQVVVLIDEYDAPMMRYLYDEKMRESVRSLLRGFYQIIKSGAAYLRFVFITGVTKFSQLSIFSELNNLYQISARWIFWNLWYHPKRTEHRAAPLCGGICRGPWHLHQQGIRSIKEKLRWLPFLAKRTRCVCAIQPAPSTERQDH